MSVTDLQFAVLSSLAAGRRHGYGLLRDAEEQLEKSLPVATAYAALEVMVSKGSAATFTPTCFMVTRHMAPARAAPPATSRATFSLTEYSR